MTVLTSDLSGISTADAALVAVVGYGVVFLGLFLLMLVVIGVGKALSGKKKAKKTQEAAPVVQEAAPATATAPGSAGQLKLHDVSPKTAAMAMAIVADKMGVPLNELRFISIKEVK